MLKEMLGIAEGILQDLHDDHEVVASLIEGIADSEDQWERNSLFQEMRAKLLTHSHAGARCFTAVSRRLDTKPHANSPRKANASISWWNSSFRGCRQLTTR